MAKQLILDTKLDSSAADALRASILDTQGEDIELDGSKVEQLGALCLELILSARHLWAAGGNSVTPRNGLAPDDRRFRALWTDGK